MNNINQTQPPQDQRSVDNLNEVPNADGYNGSTGYRNYKEPVNVPLKNTYINFHNINDTCVLEDGRREVSIKNQLYLRSDYYNYIKNINAQDAMTKKTDPTTKQDAENVAAQHTVDVANEAKGNVDPNTPPAPQRPTTTLNK